MDDTYLHCHDAVRIYTDKDIHHTFIHPVSTFPIRGIWVRGQSGDKKKIAVIHS